MRISRDQMYFAMAMAAAARGTCLRKQIGAVIVPKRGLVIIGYNGAPPGQPQCIDEGVGCLIDKKVGGCVRTLHAEVNAIAWAARHGVAIEGATLYSTVSPCLACAKAFITAGIARVMYLEPYRDREPIAYLEYADVLVSMHDAPKS